MSNFTAIGNLTGDPEYNAEHRRLRFTVAHNEREKRNGEWTDAPPMFIRCTAWRNLADNLFELHVAKGDRVIMAGGIKGSAWEKNGETVRGIEMNVQDGGRSALFAARTSDKRPAAPAGGSATDPWASAPEPTEPPF